MLKKLKINKKQAFVIIFFCVASISIGFTYKLLTGQKNFKYTGVAWQSYSQPYSGRAYLYSLGVQGGQLFFASDKKLEKDVLDRYSVRLHSESGFFDPSVCAKMPNLIVGDSLLFRGYSLKNEDGDSDIIYKFNLTKAELEAFTPKEKMVGDIYLDKEGIVYFFTIKNSFIVKNSFTADFGETLTTVTKGIDIKSIYKLDFITSLPQVKVIDSAKRYGYYLFNVEKNAFESTSGLVKEKTIYSEKNNLVVPVHNSEYAAHFSKKIGSNLVEVYNGLNEKIFTYEGEADLYFIGFK